MNWLRLPTWTRRARRGLTRRRSRQVPQSRLCRLEPLEPRLLLTNTFTQVTPFGGSAGAPMWFDYDNDTRLDAINNGRLWHNEGGGVFTDVGAAPAGGMVYPADFNNDGLTDLISNNGGSSVNVTINNGDGTWSGFGLGLGAWNESQGAAVADFTGDGFVDIYLGGYEQNDHTNPAEPDRFVTNIPDATKPGGRGLSKTWEGGGMKTRGGVSADFNEDGYPDVYTSQYRLQANTLWINNGSGSAFPFTNQAGAWSAAAGNGHSIGADVNDIDSDGDIDILAGNFAHPGQPETRVLLNRGAGGGYGFDDVGQRGIHFVESYAAPTLGDHNNDGLVDVFMSAIIPSYGDNGVFFENTGSVGNPQFTNRTGTAGLTGTGNDQDVWWADYDNDGDLDLLVADATQSRLYRNQVQIGHWLQVELHGMGLNRHGIGARVEAVVGSQRMVRQMQSGYGYASQVEPRLHFGLGTAVEVDTLQVVWPDGRIQAIGRVGADQRLQVTYPNAPTAVAIDAVLPRVLRLWPNYPNPFNNATAIRFEVPREGAVELVVYNLMGQRVAVLVAKELAAGAHRVTWDGRDESGRELASGMYLYRLRAGERKQTRKLLLLQ